VLIRFPLKYNTKTMLSVKICKYLRLVATYRSRLSNSLSLFVAETDVAASLDAAVVE